MERSEGGVGGEAERERVERSGGVGSVVVMLFFMELLGLDELRVQVFEAPAFLFCARD